MWRLPQFLRGCPPTTPPTTHHRCLPMCPSDLGVGYSGYLKQRSWCLLIPPSEESKPKWQQRSNPFFANIAGSMFAHLLKASAREKLAESHRSRKLAERLRSRKTGCVLKGRTSPSAFRLSCWSCQAAPGAAGRWRRDPFIILVRVLLLLLLLLLPRVPLVLITKIK